MSITWTAGGALVADGSGPMAYGRVGDTDVFVVVSQFSIVSYSTNNGVSWTQATGVPAGTWVDVTFGNGLFVAVSAGLDSLAITSPDGVTWTARTLPGTSVRYDSVAFGNGRFVAFPRDQTYCATSEDGITWTLRSGLPSSLWSAAIYADGKFAAVSDGSQTGAYSTDGGVSWTTVTLPTPVSWQGLAYGSAGFLASVESASSAEYATSTDFVTWTSRAYPAGGYHGAVVADQLGNYIVMRGAEASSYWSADGITWTTYAVPTAIAAWARPALHYNRVVVNGSSISAFATVPQDLEPVLTEGVAFSEASSPEVTTPVVEEVGVQDAVNATEILVAVSGISLDAALDSQVSWLGALADVLRVNDAVRLVFDIALADSIDVEALLAGDPVKTVALIDSMLLADSSLSSLSALAALSDALALVVATRSVVEGAVTDSVELAELLSALVSAYESVVAEAVLSSQFDGLATVTVLVEETVGADDSLEVAASRLAFITESLGVAVSLTLDGIPYVAFAMNAKAKAVSEYENFDYNSLAEFNGVLYGAGEAGLYRLEGATDAGTPISARVRTALLRLAGGQHSRIDSAYLGYRSDGTLQLKVVYMGEIGEKRAYVYDLQELNARDNRAGRVKVGKGLKSVYWAFELSNKDGADFDLDVLEILPLVLSRRLV